MRAVVVHGGAGRWERDRFPEVRDVLEEAVFRGFELLRRDPVGACEEAVRVLEDSGLFNAGRGSVKNMRGQVEMDASIMVSDGRAGAVGSVSGVRNPISLARAVMERSRHTMVVGEGALRFWEGGGSEAGEEGHGDTVGCVVTDGKVVVAGTSTGGLKGKEPGRVGDAGIIGAGTYASPAGGASATGDGDRIILVSLTFFVVLQISAGLSPMEACRSGIDLLERRAGGRGGVIALNVRGELGFAHNTPAMPVAYIREGSRGVLFFGFEEEKEYQKTHRRK
jgi:beta-aspartyl-peptidase (threonine type)